MPTVRGRVASPWHHHFHFPSRPSPFATHERHLREPQRCLPGRSCVKGRRTVKAGREERMHDGTVAVLSGSIIRSFQLSRFAPSSSPGIGWSPPSFPRDQPRDNLRVRRCSASTLHGGRRSVVLTGVKRISSQAPHATLPPKETDAGPLQLRWVRTPGILFPLRPPRTTFTPFPR
jgi:hypothetical protein